MGVQLFPPEVYPSSVRNDGLQKMPKGQNVNFNKMWLTVKDKC